MKNHILNTCKFDMELVPPGCHQCNAAEVAIRNLKAHFLSVLVGVADNFPPSLWDRLLPQTKIRINLIQQSNATPNVLAYAHLSGPFNYNKMPLAPMGLRPRCMRRLTNVAHGHIIRWMDGISSLHPNIIAHITATSSTPRANNFPTQCTSNTSASPISPSPTPTK